MQIIAKAAVIKSLLFLIDLSPIRKAEAAAAADGDCDDGRIVPRTRALPNITFGLSKRVKGDDVSRRIIKSRCAGELLRGLYLTDTQICKGLLECIKI